MKRYLIIGDTHGKTAETISLLNHAKYDAQDIVIFLGDYNDHFPSSTWNTKELIDEMILLRKCNKDVFFIRGNHDAWFTEWIIKGGIPIGLWYDQGGKETLESYGIFNQVDAQFKVDNIPDDHKDFLINDIQDYYFDENVIAVHGGFRLALQLETVAANLPLSIEDLDDVIWDRNFIYNHHLISHEMWKKLCGEKFLVTGHTADAPFINNTNPKWMMIDAARGLHMLIIDSHDQYRIIDNFGKVIHNVDK